MAKPDCKPPFSWHQHSQIFHLSHLAHSWRHFFCTAGRLTLLIRFQKEECLWGCGVLFYYMLSFTVVFCKKHVIHKLQIKENITTGKISLVMDSFVLKGK